MREGWDKVSVGGEICWSPVTLRIAFKKVMIGDLRSWICGQKGWAESMNTRSDQSCYAIQSAQKINVITYHMKPVTHVTCLVCYTCGVGYLACEVRYLTYIRSLSTTGQVEPMKQYIFCVYS